MGEQENASFKVWLVGVVISGMAMAVGLVAVGAHLMHLGSQIGIETVKAGLQLGVIAIVGGGVASALRYLESLREKQLKDLESLRENRRKINDYRLDVLRGVTTSYNQIKGVRRVLRSLGFNSLVASPISSDHVTEFHAQMKSLNDAQLTLEHIKREVRVRSDAFPEDKTLDDLLQKAEDYVRNVLHDWEDHGVDIVAGASHQILAPMSNLKNFLGSSEEGFDEGIGSKMKEIQKRIRALVFGKQ
jgi:hypothetical protein